MINKEVVLDRLKEIDDNAVILERLAKLDENKFVADPEKYKLAERCLQLAIECVLDIAHYVLAQKNLPRAEGAEAIAGLGEYGILPLDFAQQISPMAGFRNILVHEYSKINRHKVYAYTQQLHDFRDFQKHILAFLDSE